MLSYDKAILAAILLAAMSVFAIGPVEAQTPAAGDPTVQSGIAVQGPMQGLPASIPTTAPPPVVARAPAPPPVDTTATPDVFHGPLPFATAQCNDGWFSYAQTLEITCAGHGGVLKWILQPPPAANVAQFPEPEPLALQLLHSRLQALCQITGEWTVGPFTLAPTTQGPWGGPCAPASAGATLESP
jgi:uncharacterized protein DUF3761